MLTSFLGNLDLWVKEETVVERGGLGRDPAVAPFGEVADFEDRASDGDFMEHREVGGGVRWATEVPGASLRAAQA